MAILNVSVCTVLSALIALKMEEKRADSFSVKHLVSYQRLLFRAQIL